MQAKKLLQLIDAEFFTGVPDSQLGAFCNCLMSEYDISAEHIIAANEGTSVALAAGYHLATGKIPVVYLQNSGIGNIINPVASLLNEKVYGIPCIFIIGWRGEPDVQDEPQHLFQGEITLRLLADIGISTMVIGTETTDQEVETQMWDFAELLKQGKSVAFVVRKGALQHTESVAYQNGNAILREDIIRHIVAACGEDILISTTGKASRELFEVREQNGQSHQYDFLTVGSMGHASSIALGVALNKPHKRVWCIDGDGAALMHMGAMALIGTHSPKNMVHVIINNEAHETVGGMPTVAGGISLTQIAKACGYPQAVCVDSLMELDKLLTQVKESIGLLLIEVKAAIGSRKDLGRPTTTALQNKESFMAYLRNKL